MRSLESVGKWCRVLAGGWLTVVVYAVDRLTRRLFDFARLIELFDKSGVKLTVGNGKSEYHVVHKFGFKLKTGHSLMSGPSVVELQARLIPRQSSCL
jgi:hypothetical protein